MQRITAISQITRVLSQYHPARIVLGRGIRRCASVPHVQSQYRQAHTKNTAPKPTLRRLAHSNNVKANCTRQLPVNRRHHQGNSGCTKECFPLSTLTARPPIYIKLLFYLSALTFMNFRRHSYVKQLACNICLSFCLTSSGQ